MKEIHEFRIWDDYFQLLPKPNKAKFNGLVHVLKIPKDDLLFDRVGSLDKETRVRYNKSFFGYWSVLRIYSKKEISRAQLFHLKVKKFFEPTGEECGTVYNDDLTCEVCGANRRQIGPLILKKRSIPKKDIASTIAGEIVVSERFVSVIKRAELKGLLLEPVVFEGDGRSNYYQLKAATSIALSQKTVAGINPFDLSEFDNLAANSEGPKSKFENEVYVCPKGHTVGLNLISEPYVLNSSEIRRFDFFSSDKKIGVRRGLLQPEALYLCSPDFKKAVEGHQLTGFEFEIAHIVDDEA